MEQFVLIPQHLYEQKIKLEVKNLDTFEQKPVSVPTHLSPIYMEISHKTRSLKNESIVDQILNSPRVKLSLNDTILLDRRETAVAFIDFIFALKRKNVDFPDMYYTILDDAGINPQKVVNKDANSRVRGGWIPFKIRKSQATKTV